MKHDHGVTVACHKTFREIRNLAMFIVSSSTMNLALRLLQLQGLKLSILRIFRTSYESSAVRFDLM